MHLPANDQGLKTLVDSDGRLAQRSKPRVRVTNNGSKHDDIVSRFDPSGMAMKASAKALGCSKSQITHWRVGHGGRSFKGRFVPTNPAKQGALDSLMGNMMSPSGPPPACGPLSSFFHVDGPSAY